MPCFPVCVDRMIQLRCLFSGQSYSISENFVIIVLVFIAKIGICLMLFFLSLGSKQSFIRRVKNGGQEMMGE